MESVPHSAEKLPPHILERQASAEAPKGRAKHLECPTRGTKQLPLTGRASVLGRAGDCCNLLLRRLLCRKFSWECCWQQHLPHRRKRNTLSEGGVDGEGFY